MLQTHFKVCEQPFELTPDPRFLYLNRTYREAISSLLYRVQTGAGFMAMIAQPGMGKTMLLFHLLERLRPLAKTAFIFQTQCAPEELMQQLSLELGCGADITNPVRLSYEIKSFLLKEANTGQRCVLVIDEAQNLHPEALETIRMLSNFETPRRKLLQIILSGQSELDVMFARPELRQLRQRLSHLIHLERLTPEETTLYIAHLLRVAGYPSSVSHLFTVPALVRISQLSAGIPRIINNICANALSLAYALDLEQVDGDVIDEVANDLDLCYAGSSVSSRMLSVNSDAGLPEPGGRAYASIAATCSKLDEQLSTVPSPEAAPSQAGQVALAADLCANDAAADRPRMADDHTSDTPAIPSSSLFAAEARVAQSSRPAHYISEEDQPALPAFSDDGPARETPFRLLRALRSFTRIFLVRVGASMLVLCIAHASTRLAPRIHTISTQREAIPGGGQAAGAPAPITAPTHKVTGRPEVRHRRHIHRNSAGHAFRKW